VAPEARHERRTQAKADKPKGYEPTLSLPQFRPPRWTFAIR